jgi:hypothetical protein
VLTVCSTVYLERLDLYLSFQALYVTEMVHILLSVSFRRVRVNSENCPSPTSCPSVSLSAWNIADRETDGFS